jgi:hypothetical protein
LEEPSLAQRILIAALAAFFVFAVIAPGFAFAQTNSTTSSSTIHSNGDVEATVDAYFSATPVMIAIAKCESRFRQFDSLGNPLDGGSGGMIGVYQVNAAVHAPLAKSMGMDINTLIGNLAYANYLFQQEGTAPWLASSSCWKPAMNAASTTAVSEPTQSTESIQIAQLQAQIAQLTQQLSVLEMNYDAVAHTN